MPSSARSEPHLEINYEPLDPSRLAIVRNINGVFHLEIGTVVDA